MYDPPLHFNINVQNKNIQNNTVYIDINTSYETESINLFRFPT